MALAISLLISADGADARLKSEWKFGGGLAQLISLPFAAAILDNDVFNDGASSDDNCLCDMPNAENIAYAGNVLLPLAAQPTGGSLGGLFSRPGLVGGFSAGFLGAGVLGLVFGHGVTSELTGAASFLGLLFQITLILFLARLFWTWWRVDRSDAIAEMSPRQLADAYGRLRNESLPDIDIDGDDEADHGEPETAAADYKK